MAVLIALASVDLTPRMYFISRSRTAKYKGPYCPLSASDILFVGFGPEFVVFEEGERMFRVRLDDLEP